MEKSITNSLESAAKQIIAVLMILFGSLLAANASVGPCGGTALAVEPFPAIFVCVLGLELIVCSYFVVRRLKVEGDFRVIIYLFLVLWSLSLLLPAADLLRPAPARSLEGVNDIYFTLLRGAAAAANLVFFYKWAGAKNMIARIW